MLIILPTSVADKYSIPKSDIVAYDSKGDAIIRSTPALITQLDINSVPYQRDLMDEVAAQ